MIRLRRGRSTRGRGEGPGLRVLQVVGYLSADGSYGGPTVVAVGQCRALRAAGHQPTLLTGWDRVVPAPEGVDARRFRAWKLVRRSFASLVSPFLLLWLVAGARRFDVVHVHLARDLLTLPSAALALLLRVPLVVQTHGMVIDDERRSVRVLDRLLTRRVLRRASVVCALTRPEAEALQRLGAGADRIVFLENAAPPVSTSAAFAAKDPVVLYVSRLAARKRPVAFVEMASAVAAQRPDARFEIWGPDGGELTAVEAELSRRRLDGRCRYRGAAAMEDVPGILSRGQVLVLPSVAEPFPMVVLEALAVGLPVVMTSDTGLSERLGARRAAVVTDGEPHRMAEAVLALLRDRGDWSELSRRARDAAVSEFGAEALARMLQGCYERALHPEAPFG